MKSAKFRNFFQAILHQEWRLKLELNNFKLDNGSIRQYDLKEKHTNNESMCYSKCVMCYSGGQLQKLRRSTQPIINL